MVKTLVCAAALLIAGCASVPQADTAAGADCKIQPYQTATYAGGKGRQPTEIEKHQAAGQLAASDYRMAQLRTGSGQSGMLEEALRACNR